MALIEDVIGLRTRCPRCAEPHDLVVIEGDEVFTPGLLAVRCGHCGAVFGVCAVCGWATGTPGAACPNCASA